MIFRPQSISAAAAACVLAVSAACSTSSSPSCPDRTTQRPAGCVDTPLLAGEVRAKKITSPCELIGGEEALGTVGDFKIYNAHVQFVVQDVSMSIGWAPYGGNLLDADLVRAAGTPGNDLFGESFLNLGGRTLRSTSIDIVNNGMNGQPAVIRVKGVDAGLPILDSTVLTQPLSLSVVQDYTLEADSRSLLLTTVVTNTGKRTLSLPAGDVVVTRARVNLGSPDYGFDAGAIAAAMLGGAQIHLLAGEGRGVSYGLYSPTPYEGLVDISGVKVLVNSTLPLPPGATATYQRRVIVGDGDMASVQTEAFRLDGTTGLGHVSCSVSQPDSQPAPDAGVTVTSPASAFVSHMAVKDDGTCAGDLPAGTYVLTASAPARRDGTPATVTVTAGATTPAPLSIPSAGLLNYSISGKAFDGSAQGNIPAKIILQGPRGTKIYSHTGTGTEAVFPGIYSFTVSRGFAYSISTGTITIAEGGAPADLTVTLSHEVDTAGWVNVDTHQHSLRSVDATAPTLLKIKDNLAEGVDSFVSTEHDYIYDYTPDVLALDAAAKIKVFIGEEVSPEWSHFNGYPLTPCPSRQQNGAVLFYSYDANGKYTGFMPPEIFNKLRAAGAEIVQVNHPHSSQGLLYFLGFTPKTAIASLNPKLFSTNFDAIEILNANDMPQLRETLPSWYSMLNQGLAKTAVGVSDSHHPDQEAGYARNYIPSAAAVPGDITAKELVTAIKTHNLVLSGGPFISLTANGSPIGSTLHTAGGPVTLSIKVQAPLWMDVSTVEVIGNGVTLTTIPVTNAAVIRYEGTVTVTPSIDTWYVVIARGTGDLGPMYHGATAFALTNPVWVDADGNGTFTPPGIQ